MAGFPEPAAAALQTTDIKVNSVTPALFALAPTAEAMAVAEVAAIAEIIKTLGLYANKSRHLKGMSQASAPGRLGCAREHAAGGAQQHVCICPSKHRIKHDRHWFRVPLRCRCSWSCMAARFRPALKPWRPCQAWDTRRLPSSCLTALGAHQFSPLWVGMRGGGGVYDGKGV